MSKDWWDDLNGHPANSSDDPSDYPILVKDLEEIEVDGIFESDSPDFSDAYVRFAILYGKDCTPEQLNKINKDRVFVRLCVYRHLNPEI